MEYDAENEDQEMDKLKEEIDHLVMHEERRTNHMNKLEDQLDAINARLDARLAQLKVLKIIAFLVSKHL